MQYGGRLDTGNYVFCNNVKVKLTEVIGDGEEGIIYKTNTPFVCKIYKDDSLEELKYLKLTYMLKMNVKDRGICWPIALVNDMYGNFVGYLMPRAYGRELKEAIFKKENVLQNFKGWKKRDIVVLSLTILNKIRYLQNKGVILGDINAENILVVSATEVYFVDTDSYQINGIPCPVGTEVFTAPEIREPVYSKYLRSMGNEYFAVATLVFFIMMMGTAPYEGNKSLEIARNIKTMNFSFSLNYNGTSKNSNKESLFIWSHLPYFLREAFYETFRKGGRRSGEHSRYSTDDWIYFMNKYIEQIDKGIIKEEDFLSEDLYPSRVKIYRMK